MQAAAHSGPRKRQPHIKSARRQQRLNLLRSKHLLSVCNRAQWRASLFQTQGRSDQKGGWRLWV